MLRGGSPCSAGTMLWAGGISQGPLKCNQPSGGVAHSGGGGHWPGQPAEKLRGPRLPAGRDRYFQRLERRVLSTEREWPRDYPGRPFRSRIPGRTFPACPRAQRRLLQPPRAVRGGGLGRVTDPPTSKRTTAFPREPRCPWEPSGSGCSGPGESVPPDTPQPPKGAGTGAGRARAGEGALPGADEPRCSRGCWSATRATEGEAQEAGSERGDLVSPCTPGGKRVVRPHRIQERGALVRKAAGTERALSGGCS